MRKLSLLLGALGGAMAGYVFSNTKLREELSEAKDAEAAGKILAKHLQKDGTQIGKEIQQFVKSDVVQDNLNKAKKYVNTNGKKLRGDLQAMIKKGTSSAMGSAKKAASKAQSSLKQQPAGKAAAAKTKKPTVSKKKSAASQG